MPDHAIGDAQRPLYEIKASLFKGLAHPLRIRILEILSAASADTSNAGLVEVSVTTLLAETRLEASHLSQHLSVLRRYRLVRSERRGSVVYYHLAFPEVADLLRTARLLLAQILATDSSQLTLTYDLPHLDGARTVATPLRHRGRK